MLLVFVFVAHLEGNYEAAIFRAVSVTASLFITMCWKFKIQKFYILNKCFTTLALFSISVIVLLLLADLVFRFNTKQPFCQWGPFYTIYLYQSIMTLRDESSNFTNSKIIQFRKRDSLTCIDKQVSTLIWKNRAFKTPKFGLQMHDCKL